MKKILSLLLALALLCGLMPAALAAASMDNFRTAETYTAGKFTDVSDAAWYAGSVKTAYELGLVEGVSANSFNPNGNITIGSAIALAARLHRIYNVGSGNFIQGSPWYQVYVDYAVANGIITQGQFTDYNANATRRQFAGILAHALPAAELGAVNGVVDGDIPDLAAGSDGYDEIYTLYRAGVLTGSDAYGTFAPETTIDRASVAAIVSRMAQPALRQKVTLQQIAITGVTLDQRTLTVDEGQTAELTATVAPSNANANRLTWTSSDPDVATVSNGTVTAVAAGETEITATSASGVSASCTVTVIVPVSGISLDRNTLTLNEEDVQKLTADVQPADATDQSVTWTSSDTLVAQVDDDGTVTARWAGTATITATAGNGMSDTCTVTVVDITPVRSVSVSPSSLTLDQGEQDTLRVSIYPSDATFPEVEWTSSDPDVATVSSDGTVTAVGEGTATITAATSNGESDDCRVTVNATTELNPSVPVLGRNYGPMTLTSHQSNGTLSYLAEVDSLVFTDATSYAGEVTLNADIQFTITDGSFYTVLTNFTVRIRFLDSNGEELDVVHDSASVKRNELINRQMTFTVDRDVLEQAASIQFLSYSDEPAT